MNSLRRNEAGQIAILMVLVLPLMLMAVGLALDTGLWFWTTEWPKTR